MCACAAAYGGKRVKPLHHWTARYGLALVAVGLSALLRWAMPDVLGHAQYLGFYPAVVVAAILCGAGPGLVATFLSMLLVNLVFGQFHLLDYGLQMCNLIWVIGGVGVSLLAGKMLAARAAAEAAKEALARMSRLMIEGQEIAHVGSFEYVVEDQSILWSPEEFRIHGLEAAGGPPSYPEMLAKCYLPEDAALLDETFKAAMAAGGVYELEHRIVRPDGTVRFVYDRAHPHFDEHGRLVRYAGATVDLTERKIIEEVLSSRLMLSELAQRASADELVQKAMDEAERLTASCIGFFHLVDEDQKNLKLQAWSTNTLRNMCMAEGKGMHYAIEKAGVWVECFHKRTPVIHNDYVSLRNKKGLPKGHAPIIRELVVPVMHGDQVVAIIGVGNKKTDYTPNDAKILQMMGEPVLDLLLRKQAEESLRESEERYRSLFENMLDGFAYCQMHQLWPARADPHHSRHGQAVRLQYDLGDHQPWPSCDRNCMVNVHERVEAEESFSV